MIAGTTGANTKSTAPRLYPRPMSVSAWSSAVTKMRGVSSERGRWRISCAVSKPSMIGILTSSSTTANSLRSSCRSASAPEEASTTFSSIGARMVFKAKRLVASSSTIRMLTFVFAGGAGAGWFTEAACLARVTIGSCGTGSPRPAPARSGRDLGSRAATRACRRQENRRGSGCHKTGGEHAPEATLGNR